MSYRSRVVWNRSPADLGKAISEYGEQLVYHALVNYLERKAPEIQAQMQREAPWKDDTGEARKKLKAEVVVDGRQVALYLSQGAPHGKWLELARGGRYAIVGPTVMRIGPQIGQGLKAKMAR